MLLHNQITVEIGENKIPLDCKNGVFRHGDVCVEIEYAEQGIRCFLTANDTPVSYVTLYFDRNFSDKAKVLGDAWERSYGDLEWQHLPIDRLMPWYFFALDGQTVYAYGVKVRPASFCGWRVLGSKIALTLDVCNGTKGVVLNGRRVMLAETLSCHYNDTPFKAAQAFCSLMCQDGIMPDTPVYGSNNWYYAYGKSSEGEILRDAELLASLTKGLENRPYMIIDDCWSVNSCAGPWDTLDESFKDMRGLAEKIRAMDVKLGIWLRPLFYKNCDIPQEWLLRTLDDGGMILDITVPAARAYVLDNFARLKAWGYEIIKHDFTTCDIFGGYAYQFDGFMSRGRGEWAFRDGGKTNAEIIVEFYKDIRRVTDGVMIMGCNTVSHLIAGLAELQRIGDDTSGIEWERTRKMGVNTLAFRLCQHGSFYAVDADCVGITPNIEWGQNNEWLTLVANSGTPLFVSLNPDCATDEILSSLNKAYAVNSVNNKLIEPLDWLEIKTPRTWKMKEKIFEFNWHK